MAEHPIYQRLAGHLDRLPGGFAPSRTGAHLRLLQALFTPSEAELAMVLTLQREGAEQIARRAGLDTDDAARRLEEMARKGLIFAAYAQGAPVLYQAAPWIVGIYEFQSHSLTPELVALLREYETTRGPARPVESTGAIRTSHASGQMRTIPVHKSLEARVVTLPYERIDDLVGGVQRIGVTQCICRRKARVAGGECIAPDETCIVFDEWAEFYANTGRGRLISRDELAGILGLSDELGLVLQPSNSREPSFLCCCCSCCCGVLRGIKRNPHPSELVSSPFVAAQDLEACNGCRSCVTRCPMQALPESGDQPVLDASRCIGCGLCVTTCPTGALQLVRRPDAHQADVPADLAATWRALSRL